MPEFYPEQLGQQCFEGSLLFITDIKKIWFEYGLRLINQSPIVPFDKETHARLQREKESLTIHRRPTFSPLQQETIRRMVKDLIDTTIAHRSEIKNLQPEVTRISIRERYGLESGKRKRPVEIQREFGIPPSRVHITIHNTIHHIYKQITGGRPRFRISHGELVFLNSPKNNDPYTKDIRRRWGEIMRATEYYQDI